MVDADTVAICNKWKLRIEKGHATIVATPIVHVLYVVFVPIVPKCVVITLTSSDARDAPKKNVGVAGDARFNVERVQLTSRALLASILEAPATASAIAVLLYS